MEKPKGGRGNKASYKTKVVRLPVRAAIYAVSIADNSRKLIDDGRDEESINFSAIEREQAISFARNILKEKKSVKQSLQKLLQVLYETDISL
jgi:hypothetical protein